MNHSIPPKLIVEYAILHFRGDKKHGIFPHTVKLEGLDFRREEFENDEDFKGALDRARTHLQKALEELFSEEYQVTFDFERQK